MELAEPGLETYLRALRNAFHRIDSFWELPDELKDQRKFEVMGDLVGQMCGLHDDEFVRQVGRVAVADGLEPMMVMLVIDGAIERARLAAEYREAVSRPKRPGPSWEDAKRRAVNFEPKPARELSKATKDAIDWFLRWNPNGLAAFVESRTDEELAMIDAYIAEREGRENG